MVYFNSVAKSLLSYLEFSSTQKSCKASVNRAQNGDRMNPKFDAVYSALGTFSLSSRSTYSLHGSKTTDKKN